MIETEIKFLYEEEKIATLISDATLLEEKELTDIYFDDEEFSLFLSDTYLRDRNGGLELKVPTQDNSGELKSYDEITKLIEKHLPKPLQEYAPAITVHTSRKSYEKDGVRIDLDIATINGKTYRIGELEITGEENAQNVENHLRAIIEQYTLTPVRYGKVFLYIKEELPELYTQLQKQGVAS